MENLISKVDDLIGQLEDYGADELIRIIGELKTLAEPYKRDLTILEQNEMVQKYIATKKITDYIYDKTFCVISYLPK